MRQASFDFQGCRLKQCQNRDMRDIQRIPFIRVMIYEAPHELDNLPILQKLTQYGKLQEQSVYRHKHRGLDIYNGARSVNFVELTRPIPTTIYVHGNRIKLKHMGQDRTPICAQCKQRGHYRLECPVSQRIDDEIDEEQHSEEKDKTQQDENQEQETQEQKKETTERKRDLDMPPPPEKNGTCLSQDEWNIVQRKGSTARARGRTPKKDEKKKTTRTKSKSNSPQGSKKKRRTTSQETIVKDKREEEDENEKFYRIYSHNKPPNSDEDIEATFSSDASIDSYASPSED